MKLRERLAFVKCNRAKRTNFAKIITKFVVFILDLPNIIKFVVDDLSKSDFRYGINIVVEMCEQLLDRCHALF